MKKIMAAAALSLLLVGCSGTSEKTQDAEPKKEATAAASQVEETEAVEDAPDPVTLDEIDCSMDYYNSVEEAWEGEQDLCDATVSGSEMSDIETKALKTAYGDEGDLDSLGN